MSRNIEGRLESVPHMGNPGGGRLESVPHEVCLKFSIKRQVSCRKAGYLQVDKNFRIVKPYLNIQALKLYLGR